LDLHFSGLQRLPDSVCQLTALTSLNMYGCSGLQQLPSGLGQLRGLTLPAQHYNYFSY
jgi:hypothetical protein